MTREQVLAMEAGRELDMLVAEKVMGMTYVDYVPRMEYSKRISAAWEALEQTGMRVEINGHRHTGWSVDLIDVTGERFVSEEWELPLAACKASLLAVMGI